MKFIYKAIIILLFFNVLNVRATTNQDSTLISRFRPGVMWFYTGIKPAQTEKPRKYDRVIVDLTYNTWNGDQKPFSNLFLSLGLNTSLLFDIPLTKGNTISLGTGLTHSYFHIRHNETFISDPKGFTNLKAKDSLETFKSSKLGGNTLYIPLEFRFRGKNWKHAKLHIGAKVGYQLNLFNQYTYSDANYSSRVKSFFKSDVNPLQYGCYIRFGSRVWGAYVGYNSSRFFKNSASTKLNLIQVGLSLSLF